MSEAHQKGVKKKIEKRNFIPSIYLSKGKNQTNFSGYETNESMEPLDLKISRTIDALMALNLPAGVDIEIKLN